MKVTEKPACMHCKYWRHYSEAEFGECQKTLAGLGTVDHEFDGPDDLDTQAYAYYAMDRPADETRFVLHTMPHFSCAMFRKSVGMKGAAHLSH